MWACKRHRIILYVRVYFSKEILFRQLKYKFSILIHLKLSNLERIIVKKSILFGINPLIIQIRKVLYIIGFDCNDNWVVEIHSGVSENILLPIIIFINVETHFMLLLNKYKSFTKWFCRIIFYNNKFKNNCNKFFKSFKVNPVLSTEKSRELIGNQQLDWGKD